MRSRTLNTKTWMPFVALVGSLLLGCQAEPEPVDIKRSAEVTVSGGTSCVTLLAGQTINAGTVCSTVQGDYLNVTYSTTGGWELTEAHLWAGTSLASLPTNRAGNPQIGLFPYNSGNITGATTYTFSVPLSTFGLSGNATECAPTNVYLVAHAALRKLLGDGSYQTETGYGEGTRLVSKGNWATWFSLTLKCQDTQPETCETAWAYGGSAATCFLSIDENNDGQGDFNRWGWTNPVSAPASGSTTSTFELWAGAGQCDRSKGTLVGTVTVVYDGSTATVTYAASTGFTFDETHLYAGSALLPSVCNGSGCEFTVAPGQLGNLHDLTSASSDSYSIGSLSGNIHVAAHAVVCSSSW